MSDYFGKEVPKLGFGLMRLPHKGLGTDIEQTKKMVDMFLDAGFTYFDTEFSNFSNDDLSLAMTPDVSNYKKVHRIAGTN